MKAKALLSRMRLSQVALLVVLMTVLPLCGNAPALAYGYEAEYLAPFAVPAAINEAGSVVGWNPVYQTAFVYDGNVADVAFLAHGPGLGGARPGS